jgi:hypothetical protein
VLTNPEEACIVRPVPCTRVEHVGSHYCTHNADNDATRGQHTTGFYAKSNGGRTTHYNTRPSATVLICNLRDEISPTSE